MYNKLDGINTFFLKKKKFERPVHNFILNLKYSGVLLY